ncbi:hypothetical protein L9F63_017027 [Diploptera punctata]|uniref:Uncharacterized protein n=1 Tax=Diploptera punctata TaxID=6984 RepID=A0AAD8EHK7_DIPPU|nr:hypothetical protein L9F63_017027 [Diploptera punctata]
MDITKKNVEKFKTITYPEAPNEMPEDELVKQVNLNNSVSGESVDSMIVEVVSNKNKDNEKAYCTVQEVVSDLSNVMTIDASPRKKETLSPTPSSEIEKDTRNEKEDESKRDEAKECKINANGSTVNNRESNEVSAAPAVSRTAEIMSATIRRVNFRNNVSKTITGSFSSDVVPSTPFVVTVTKPTPIPPPNRILSAPPQKSVPKPSPSQPTPKCILVQRSKRPILQSTMSLDMMNSVDATEGEDGEDDKVRGERNVKSAPARRRLKTAGPRRKSRGRGEESSGDEVEASAKDKEKSSASRAGRRGLVHGTEIVTMVSLMSDGSDVDTDPSDLAPGAGIAPWLEERNPSRTAQNEQAPAPPRVVCLRKTPKSGRRFYLIL